MSLYKYMIPARSAAHFRAMNIRRLGLEFSVMKTWTELEMPAVGPIRQFAFPEKDRMLLRTGEDTGRRLELDFAETGNVDLSPHFVSG